MADKTSRRTFLATTGACALGIGCGVPVLASLSKVKAHDPDKPRYAMVVDVEACRKKGDCQDCAAACHAAHNVPDIETIQHEVKWIWKEPFERAFPNQDSPYLDEKHKGLPTIVMCNHCENPPCVRVCPTGATWKRDDGIVTMDMHRCIGCRYCTVACPYGSRSFNWMTPWPREEDGKPWPKGKPPTPDYPTRSRGVVEKCNFCAERIADGEPPICVQACEAGALHFGDVNDPKSEVHELLNDEFTIRRKPGLGTLPHVFYVIARTS